MKRSYRYSFPALMADKASSSQSVLVSLNSTFRASYMCPSLRPMMTAASGVQATRQYK